MPKFSEKENQFWTMMLHYANNGKQKLYCNICHRKIRSQTKECHNHFFGKSHPNKNIYEIFSPVEIPDYVLIPDSKTGVPLPEPKENKK
jgi:hypothetical protein